jgi:hypothetical protein
MERYYDFYFAVYFEAFIDTFIFHIIFDPGSLMFFQIRVVFTCLHFVSFVLHFIRFAFHCFFLLLSFVLHSNGIQSSNFLHCTHP